MAEGDIKVGKVSVDVEPDLSGFSAKARAEILPEAQRLGQQIGRAIGAPIARQVSDAINDGVVRGSRAIQPHAVKAGNDFGQAFARAARARIEAGLRDANIGIRVESLAALREVQRVKAALEDLARTSPTITVRVEGAIALAELARIRGEVERLSQMRPSVQVDVDTARARTQLRALQLQIVALRGVSDGIDITVDTDRAGGQMRLLIGVIAALGPVAVVAAAVASAAIVAIAGAALVAVAGVGVLALALSGVIKAVTAMGKAQEEAGQRAAGAAQRQLQIAGATDQIRSATRALAAARANAADATVRSEQQVQAAQRSLTAAERDAKRARLELNQAYEDARKAHQDLQFQIEGGALAQRQATLDELEARAELDKVRTNPKASKEDVEQAKIRHEQALLRIRELSVQQGRLVQEQTVANKVGIDGSRQVVEAKERIREADEGVAEAQRGVADALRAQVTQQRQSADSIASAQQGVISAQRSLTQALQSSSTTGQKSLEDLRKAMAKLTPEGRAFATFLFGLRGQFTELRKTAERNLLPGLQAGIQAALPLLPHVNNLVAALASVLGDLFKEGGEALGSPFWRTFFDYLASIAGPTMTVMVKSIGNLIKAFAGLLMAFTPTSKQMGEGFLEMTERFAEWATTLDENQGFQDFLAYVQENGPKFIKLLGDIFGFLWRIGVVLAPLGEITLDGLVALFDWIAGLDATQFTILVGAIGGLVIGLTLLAGGPIGLIIAGIVLLVGAVIYAYKNFDGFRNLVDTVWKAIATGAVWLWENVLKPTWDAIVGFVMGTLVPAFEWLWKEVLVPAWEGIAAVIKWAWEQMQPGLAAIDWWISHVIGPVFKWLYEHVIKPVWSAIQVAVKVAWAVLQVIFGVIQIAVKILAGIFLWFWNEKVKPMWALFTAGIKIVWDKVKPIFEMIGGFIKDKVVPVFKSGVAALGKAWDGIIALAKLPVKFVVNTVLNDGILAAYNKVAKIFHVKPDNVRIDLPKGFRTGGPVWGDGTETSDSILARLSHNEHVWTAEEVRRAGGHAAMKAMRQAALRGQKILPGFAGGGGITGWLQGVKDSAVDKVSDAKDWVIGNLASMAKPLADQVGRLVDKIPGTGAFVDVLKGMARSVLGNLTSWMTKKDGEAAKFSGGSFTPGSGDWPPRTSDGSMSANTRAAQQFIKNRWPGITAGTYYSNQLWSDHHWGKALDIMMPSLRHPVGYEIANYFAANPKQYGTKYLIYAGKYNGGQGWGPYSMPGQGDHSDHVHLSLFDEGGWLPPGLSMVMNASGKPEPVLTAQEWQEMRSSKGGSRHYEFNVHAAPSWSEHQLMTAMRNAESLFAPGL